MDGPMEHLSKGRLALKGANPKIILWKTSIASFDILHNPLVPFVYLSLP